jgi:hypothetical protein
MFRLETDEIPLQDDLPPEILRRLQVEELWARRHVLAELMNSERLKVYAQRRAMAWPALFSSIDSAGKYKPAKRPAMVVPIKHRKSFAPGH